MPNATKTRITEAQAERMADRRVLRRLQTDSAYRNAEDAQAQSEREDAIELEVWRAIAAQYEID